jgi:hypothetical protein
VLKSGEAHGTSRARVRATELKEKDRIVTKASLRSDDYKFQIPNSRVQFRLESEIVRVAQALNFKNFCDALMPAVNFMVKPRD